MDFLLRRLPSEQGNPPPGSRFRSPPTPLPRLPTPRLCSPAIENADNVAIVHAILEDIVQHTLSNLHNIEKSLTFWLSRAKGTSLQKMYFMIFQRGPRAFVEATCQTLTRLRSFKSPSHYLLDSAYDMIRTKLAGPTSIQHCLAAFLAEVSSHKKPSRMTIYWLPYTCGAIGLPACSLWLLRHSSLGGSSDMDNWIRCAKESVTIFRDKPAEKSTSSLGDERLQTFESTDELTVKKQEFQLIEKSLNRYDEESVPIQNVFDEALAMLIQVEKRLAYQKADLALLRDQLQKIEILAALPTYGVPLLLIYLGRALVMHVQKGRRRTARRQRWRLLRHVESCMVNQMKEDASCKFGLALYNLDRLYRDVESAAKGTGEWLLMRKEIIDLSKPDGAIAAKLDIISRMRTMYTCLHIPTPME